jgi:hypothetical protein
MGPRASAVVAFIPWQRKSSTNAPAGAQLPKSTVVPAKSLITAFTGPTYLPPFEFIAGLPLFFSSEIYMSLLGLPRQSIFI